MKLSPACAQEILVGHVAPADHRHGAVGDEQLVVHAVVHAPNRPPRRAKRADLAARTPAEGVEQAHLHVRVAARASNSSSVPVGVEVVDQQPHAHAAMRRRRAARAAASGRSRRSRGGSTARRATPRRGARAAPACRANTCPAASAGSPNDRRRAVATEANRPSVVRSEIGIASLAIAWRSTRGRLLQPPSSSSSNGSAQARRSHSSAAPHARLGVMRRATSGRDCGMPELLARNNTIDAAVDLPKSIRRNRPYGAWTQTLSLSALVRVQVRGCTPNAQASSVKLTKASTVLLMMMRATRPLSAP